MKKLAIVLLVAPLVLTGCAGVVSLNPLAVPNGKDTAFDPALMGSWEELKSNSDAATNRYVVDRSESGYRVTLLAGPDKAEGTMHLMKLGKFYLLDVLSPSDGAPPSVHLFFRLRLENEKAWLSEMDTEWLKDQIEAGGQLRHEVETEGERFILTGSTYELRRYLLPLAGDDRAFAKEFELCKIK